MLTKEQVAAVLAQAHANNPRLRDVIAQKRAEAIKYLTQANDPVAVYRAQGQITMLEALDCVLVSAN